MQNMYKLLKPIDNGLTILVKEVQEHVTRIGLEAVSNLFGDNVAQLFVENVLEVHKKHLNMIRDVFNGDQLFTGALDKACASVINHRKNTKLPCRSPGNCRENCVGVLTFLVGHLELLARYCDALLKKSVRGLSESEIDDKLAASITVFKVRYFRLLFVVGNRSIAVHRRQGRISEILRKDARQAPDSLAKHFHGQRGVDDKQAQTRYTPFSITSA